MSFRFPSPLYAVADPCGRPGLDPVLVGRRLLDGGARLVQLRWKAAPSGALLGAAVELARLAAQRSALFLVNDRADVAVAAAANGVHLGQEDLPLEAARRLLGPGRVIGVSTHDLGQARAAERGGADYIGFGPIFETGTKSTGTSARGLDELREIRRAIHLPIVAIGGIREESAAQVLAAGADAVAMISELALCVDPAAKVRSVLQRIATR